MSPIRNIHTPYYIGATNTATSTRHVLKSIFAARDEVAVLAQRRDDIAAQLGSLAEVIEALAVPEPSAVPQTNLMPDRGEVHV